MSVVICSESKYLVQATILSPDHITAQLPTILIARRNPALSAIAISIFQAPDFAVLPPVFDGLDALNIIVLMRPTVAILACDLTGLTPMELLERLADEPVPTRFVVHAKNSDPAVALDAFRLRALGYLHCDAGPDELLGCVRAVLRNKPCLSQNLLSGLLSVTLKAVENQPSGYRGLSRRELDVFSLIGQGLSSREIADRLSPRISEDTVETHRRHIREKLGITGGGSALLKEAIAYALKKRER